MKTTSNLSLKQRRICIIVDSVATFLLGVFLLLVGLKIIYYDFYRILLSSILLFGGIAMSINAFVQSNSLILWIGSALAVCACVGFIVEANIGFGYSDLYPIYIAAPAIASLITLFIKKEYKIHLLTAVFFGIISILFSLESSGILPISIVLPIVLMVVGLIISGAVFIKGEGNGK